MEKSLKRNLMSAILEKVERGVLTISLNRLLLYFQIRKYKNKMKRTLEFMIKKISPY